MEINGIAHVMVTVSDSEACLPFYERLLAFLGMKTLRPFAPGYYSVLFEDPDGIRLEVNHVPGKGVLADSPGS